MKLSLPDSPMAIRGGSARTADLALAGDSRSTDALKAKAARNPKEAIKDAAKQFEALFMQELMKSMRKATLATGMLDNDASRMGTEMLDQQFATQMTGMPGGLAAAIARQLERQMGGGTAQPTEPPNGKLAGSSDIATPEEIARAAAAAGTGTKQADFVSQHNDAAEAAEAATGIPASFMVAQAAHESGWGKREIRNADGSTSFNVFGIKAGGSWTGKTAEVMTTEYVNGRPRKQVASFRSYNSYEEAFKDYAKLMKNSPRYSQVVANASTAQGFAQGLQRAGYATDPAYAAKLTQVINTTLRLQRVLT
ncbi:flagellar assembly peptidoglycan hydrolase FlgJ [Piscinibacter sakaiensis]|uniref:flagellar assembly peptidoglycan hydrolase FlgJ n=1 Tax=Piscinibacter sakaiensis TaxID=1547922 RepID=UPI003AAC63AD